MRLSKPITYFPSFPAGKLTVMSTQNLNEKVSPDRTFQGLYLKDQDHVPGHECQGQEHEPGPDCQGQGIHFGPSGVLQDKDY